MGKAATENVYFDVYSSDLRRWYQKRFKAKLFGIDGRTFRLFRIGVLAEILSRTTRTIADWERAKKIPESIFQVTLSGDYDEEIKQRWYSEGQIRMMQKHMREILSDQLTRTKTPLVNHEAFFSAVKRDWYLDLEDA